MFVMPAGCKVALSDSLVMHTMVLLMAAAVQVSGVWKTPDNVKFMNYVYCRHLGL